MSNEGAIRGTRRDIASFFFTGLTGLCTAIITLILLIIVGNIVYHGWGRFTLGFLTRGTEHGMFDLDKAGIFPMIFGTAARVLVMTMFVVPIGVITAIYMTEYAHRSSRLVRLLRGAINNLAGVPSIVFGLFGVGFFINFVGGQMDLALNAKGSEPIWGKPAIIWASLTLAVMTLPVVIVATEEALKAIPAGLREASLALGATKLETIIKIVFPQALPGILTGGILAISRATGEVAPILFTGAAYYMASLPKSLSDQFMDLGYHVYILSTQAQNVDETRPLLYATVLALLALTFALNIVAIFVRARMRAQMRALH
ncbi:MAG TPA: phosphate ABC transporter permease PstA [Methylomirabilota bacterium]|nr:phosphate ABC transporter permease PstA [Methylomirabilota bacterium]